MPKLTTALSDAALDRAFGFLKDEKTLALAVSGGGDSMALLRLALPWAARNGVSLTALTVEHGLRPESADEARQVADWCAALGVNHKVLRWQHGDAQGNLPQIAREARYRLMAEDCAANGIAALATGHTRDDQAETVLMRLARGSGVDGLSAMAADTTIWGIRVVRPLLGWSRAALRDELRRIGQPWIDDPTNEDDGYDRIKARRALDLLAPLGLTPERLARTARMMGLARQALDEQAAALMRRTVIPSPIGYVTLAPAPGAPREIALRVLAEILRGVSGSAHRPRLDPLEDALDWVHSTRNGGRTLHGCLLRRRDDGVIVMREPRACANTTQSIAGQAIWDGRFAVGPCPPPTTVAALSEVGLAQLPPDIADISEAWANAPRDARLTTPALWNGKTLLSAPFVPWAAPEAPPVEMRAIWPASCVSGTEMVE